MSKRARQTLTNLGNLPYTTNDGGKWLRKVLDPVDIDVDVIGIPDTETNPRAVLNYQMQSEIPIPRQSTYIPATVSSYDADLYVFQDPIIFGVAFSYPQGTKNIGGTTIQFDLPHKFIQLADGCAPRTENVILNDQIEGADTKGKLESLKRYCQRFRMIYGGVQCIPACSALYDSGTIEATQQVFSPENTNVSDFVHSGYGNQVDGKVYRCQTYSETDFPDVGNSIQNPASLYCRYKEGLYMPYKLRNPLVHSYRGSEERTFVECPYIVTDITFMYENEKVPTTYDPATLRYNTEANNIDGIWIECCSKMGHKFAIRWTSDVGNQVGNIVLPTSLKCYKHAGNVTSRDARIFNLSETGIHQDLGPEENQSLPVTDTNIGVVSFKSIGLQAAVRLVFRMGVEMMITAGGVYSPFKHKAPKYDQRAINSYIRACHNMRDAFLGDAATPDGHSEFSAHLAEIVASGDNVNVSNVGSSWYGRVRTS